MGSPSTAKACLALLVVGAVAILPGGPPARAGDAAAPLRYEGQPFMRNFTPRNYHADTPFWSAAQDARGVMYVGNQACVLEYDSASWRRIPVGKTGWTSAMAYDAPTDRVYVGGSDELGYLETAPDGTRTFVSLLALLPADARPLGQVKGMYPTPMGVFFVDGRQVMRWRDGQFRTWRLTEGTPLSSGWAVGNLYVQTPEIGLLRLDGDAFVPASADPVFRRASVRSVVTGANGEVLIGTFHDGLFTLRDGTIRPVPTEIDGFLKAKVFGPMQGYLPMQTAPQKLTDQLVTGATGNGVVHLDVPRWEKERRGRPFSPLIRRASATDEQAPANNRSAVVDETLPYARNSVHFEFAANTFAFGSAVRYQTRLVNFGPGAWSDFGEGDRIDYLNLPEGSYRFEVRARDVDGQPGTVASLSFRIAPPWQRTPLAYAGYALAVALAVAALVRWRGHHLRRRNAALAALVDTRTGELRGREAELVRARRRRERQPGQERVPGQHEPRTAHPAQRHRRLQPDFAQEPRPPRAGPRAGAGHRPQRRASAGDDQRGARPVQGGSRQADTGPVGFFPTPTPRRHGGGVPAASGGEGTRIPRDPRAGPAGGRAGGPGPAATGAFQPVEQRGEVHPPGGRAVGGHDRRAGARAVRGGGHRHRNRRTGPARDFRRVPSGGRQRAGLAGHGAGTGDQPAASRAARRADRGGEHARAGQPVLVRPAAAVGRAGRGG